MTVAAASNALLVPADLKGSSTTDPGPLGITSSAQDDMLQELINRASAEVESYCGRRFAWQEFEDLRLPGQTGPRLRPPGTPIDIDEPIVISLDGTALTVWTAEVDGDPVDHDVIVGCDDPGVPSYFYRQAGWRGSGPIPIRLTYTGGYTAVPADLKEAVQMVVQTFYRHRQQLADISSMPGGAGGGMVTFRDYIPLAAMKTLDRYRMMPLG